MTAINDLICMKMKKYIKTMIVAALALCSCSSDEFDRPDYYDNMAETKLGKPLVAGASSYIVHVKTEKQSKVSEGVTLLDMGYLNSNGHAMQLYLYKVVLGGSELRVFLPDDKGRIAAPQKMTEMATTVENKSVYMTFAVVNGGVFAADGKPTGILYQDGNALSDSMGNTPVFFATRKDGTAVCAEASEFESVKSKIYQGVSGTAMILKEGYVLPQNSTTASATTAIGVNSDGTEVYLLIVDGGDFYYSNGISANDAALLLQASGCTEGMILNTGNNVAAVRRNERSEDLFELLNKPANKGLEPAVGNALAIVVK